MAKVRVILAKVWATFTGQSDYGTGLNDYGRSLGDYDKSLGVRQSSE